MLNRWDSIRRNEDYDKRIYNGCMVDAGIFLLTDGLVYNIRNFYIHSDAEYRKEMNFIVKCILSTLKDKSTFSYPVTGYKNISEILYVNNYSVNIIFVVNDGVVHRMVFVGKELIEEEYYGDIRRIK